jgi:hypothetical protein
VAYMLIVPALESGSPIAFRVLVIACDLSFHELRVRCGEPPVSTKERWLGR